MCNFGFISSNHNQHAPFYFHPYSMNHKFFVHSHKIFGFRKLRFSVTWFYFAFPYDCVCLFFSRSFRNKSHNTHKTPQKSFNFQMFSYTTKLICTISALYEVLQLIHITLEQWTIDWTNFSLKFVNIRMESHQSQQQQSNTHRKISLEKKRMNHGK